jgi:hypothetical protein
MKASPGWRSKQESASRETQKHLVGLDQTFGNFLHIFRRGPTSFGRRFLEESEKSLHGLFKTAFTFFESLLQINFPGRMVLSPYLHVSMPHVEKLADFLVLLLPIYPLTSPGTVHGGLACIAVLEHDIQRCFYSTYDAALGHHCCPSREECVLGVWYEYGNNCNVLVIRDANRHSKFVSFVIKGVERGR